MPTFGNTTAGAGIGNLSNDYRGSPADSPASDGTANKLSVYQLGWTAGETMIGALYDASDNSLVAATDSVVGPQTGISWVDLPFSGTVNIYSAKSYYCMVLIPTGSTISVYYTTGVSANKPSANDTGDVTPPATCAVVSGTAYYSVYCTYTESVATVLGLAGSADGTSGASGAVGSITPLSLAGSSAGSSGASAALTIISTLGLAGTSAGTSSVSGALSIEASSNADCLVDANATFHADLIGALCYMTSGDNSGEAQEIETVDADGNIMTFASSFNNSISVNDRYSISPVPFKARLWPLQMKEASRFQRWIMEAVSIKVKNTFGVRTGSGAILPGGYWRVGAYRNSGDTIESEVAYVEVDENPSDSAGALNIDGVDIEPYIEQISSGTKFELENVEVLVQETDSREVSD